MGQGGSKNDEYLKHLMEIYEENPDSFTKKPSIDDDDDWWPERSRKQGEGSPESVRILREKMRRIDLHFENSHVVSKVGKAASNFDVALKGISLVGKRLPVIGAVVTAGFVLAETAEYSLKGEFGKAGAALAIGTAEAAGNIVGFGLGDAAREGTRGAFIAVAGEEYSEIEKSGLRSIAEEAFSLAEKLTEDEQPEPTTPTTEHFKPSIA